VWNGLTWADRCLRSLIGEGWGVIFERQKAILLAGNINNFTKFVHKNYKNKDNSGLNSDKFFQVKLLIEEYKFQMLADELLRINQFDWDKKYTYYLLDRFLEGLAIIDEYVENHYHDLFILSARIYNLKSISHSFDRTEYV